MDTFPNLILFAPENITVVNKKWIFIEDFNKKDKSIE